MKRMSIARRIERNAQPAASGCVLWVGAWRNRGGYGALRFGDRIYLAHRAAYEVKHGPIPAGLCVMHSCDNPLCVNVDHLSLGTRAENSRDRDRKGRTARGPALSAAQKAGIAAAKARKQAAA